MYIRENIHFLQRDAYTYTTFATQASVSIAINPTVATLQVGHSGLALWMDKKTGRWTTSSYYETALPSWAGKTADDYLNKRWEPLHLAALYYAAPRVRNKNFVYDLNQFCYGSAKYEQFATTPYANDMVVDLAMEAVQNYAIGKDLQTDMLLLQFSLQPLFTQQTDGLTLELEDAYLRLDKELETLLDFLDKGISFDQIHIETEYIVSHYAASGSDVSAADVYEIMEYAASKGYAAKQKYVSCSNETREENERRRYLRDRLTQVDENHGFEVWCQPIKCMATGKFCSMEALIRMREPNGKLISPAEFIPLAEETGQINAITWFVLNQVCRMLKSNPELEDTSVSINVPMSQLIEKDFASRFISTVDAFGVEHRRICIEFTERTILESFQHMQSAMNVLTDAGFRFFLDDFGVGYSNFNCLISLPFNVIKFDSALIHRDIDGLQQFETIKALTSLFHGRNLTVVAEGIEKPEEVQMLTEIGVDRIQGYVFARPMPENELLRFYREM